MKCPPKSLVCLIVELGVTGLKSREETLHNYANDSDNWCVAPCPSPHNKTTSTGKFGIDAGQQDFFLLILNLI